MKKIAYFSGQLFGEYIIEVTRALIHRAEELGYQVDVFTNFGVYGNNFMYAEGEKSIIQLPNLSEYAGVIAASDNFEISGFEEVLFERLEKEFSGPIVSLRQKEDKFYSITIDDYHSMKALMEHFIVTHGYRRICFMTGRMELEDAQQRLRAYQDAMEEHGIPVTEHMIFEGDYWRFKGAEAVSWFFDQEKLPEAIVCSNDYMALSVFEELIARGIRVPEDIALSGFDDLEETKFSVPPITTLHMPNDLIGQKAVETVDALLRGEEPKKTQVIQARLCVRGSCGCEYQPDIRSVRELLSQKGEIETTMSEMAYMSVSFDNAQDMDALLQTANFYARNLPFDRMFVCLCDDEEREQSEDRGPCPYTEHMILTAVRDKKKEIRVNERFERVELLPAKYRNESTCMYYVGLHDKLDFYGYIAIEMNQLNNMHHAFQMWNLSFADALGQLKMYANNELLAQLRKQFEIDELTGIGNRRRLERVVRSHYDKLRAANEQFAILSIDMDGLKLINDNYGHLEGDNALKKLAIILEEETMGKGVAMRTGGDEFQVCLDTANPEEVEDYIRRARERIAAENAKGLLPYEFSASFGYAICAKRGLLLESMRIADVNMYAEKRSKKTHRQ